MPRTAVEFSITKSVNIIERQEMRSINNPLFASKTTQIRGVTNAVRRSGNTVNGQRCNANANGHHPTLTHCSDSQRREEPVASLVSSLLRHCPSPLYAAVGVAGFVRAGVCVCVGQGAGCSSDCAVPSGAADSRHLACHFQPLAKAVATFSQLQGPNGGFALPRSAWNSCRLTSAGRRHAGMS